jgi:TRAP-type C4-dicarboxylate transport system permease small subunit
MPRRTAAGPSDESGRLITRLDRWLSPIETGLNLIAAAFIFFLMLIGVWQVVGRKLFNLPIFGYIDIIELSMTAFAFLGIAYCQRLGGHVRMELVLDHLKGRTLWLMEVAMTVVALVVIAVIGYYAYDHFLRAYHSGDSTIDAEYPVWPSKLVVPVALAILWLRLLIQLAGYLRLVASPGAEPVGVPRIATIEELARKEIEDARIVEEEAKRRG